MSIQSVTLGRDLSQAGRRRALPTLPECCFHNVQNFSRNVVQVNKAVIYYFLRQRKKKYTSENTPSTISGYANKKSKHEIHRLRKSGSELTRTKVSTLFPDSSCVQNDVESYNMRADACYTMRPTFNMKKLPLTKYVYIRT